MIVVTGAAGFIGSNLVKRLESMGHHVIKVDYYKDTDTDMVDVSMFFQWFNQNKNYVKMVFHLGACADTLETDRDKMWAMNTGFSISLWFTCTLDKIPLIYASSAATYGLGEHGYDDNHEVVDRLKPLNIYGESKNDFDKFAIKQSLKPPFWAGLKFFNVYGLGEHVKGKMASMIYQGYNQIKDTKKMRLFKYGEHTRDFVYIEDILNVCIWMMNHKPESGLYNVGTGNSWSFNELAKNIFYSLHRVPHIEYIDMPEAMVGKYQSSTKANMNKLRKAGYSLPFYSLEAGISDYIKKLEYENSNISVLPKIEKWQGKPEELSGKILEGAFSSHHRG